AVPTVQDIVLTGRDGDLRRRGGGRHGAQQARHQEEGPRSHALLQLRNPDLGMIPPMAPPDPPEISLVIPVYNEEENLPVLDGEIRAAMQAAGRPYEVIYVDDGSSD